MKKTTLNEEEIIDLLTNVLPETTQDPKLAVKIVKAIQKELKQKSQGAAFAEFCRSCPLPDLKKETVQEVTERFQQLFGAKNLELVPDQDEKVLRVELNLPKAVFRSEIAVNGKPLTEEDEEEEVKLKFIAFPVALPGDPENVWMMAKKENMSNEEAGIALLEVQTEFWESKSGQNQLRKGAERTFPEFVSRVPAKMLSEVGLKRHYKEPEPVKVLHQPKL